MNAAGVEVLLASGCDVELVLEAGPELTDRYWAEDEVVDEVFVVIVVVVVNSRFTGVVAAAMIFVDDGEEYWRTCAEVLPVLQTRSSPQTWNLLNAGRVVKRIAA